MTKREALRLLGLPDGAGWESIKKRQRELVKRHHPDNFTEAAAAEQAHHEMAEINRAVHYLKRLHKTGIVKDVDVVTPRKPRAAESVQKKEVKPTSMAERSEQVVPPEAAKQDVPNTSEKSENAHATWAEQKRRKAPARGELDRKFTEHRRKTVNRYASLLQDSFFTRFMVPKTTSIGAVGATGIFERYVEFRKIQNALFYAINQPLNVVLKYSGLFFFVVLLIRSVMSHFYQGRLVFQEAIFYAKISWLFAGFLFLSLTDLIFRYAITYRYGRLDHPFYTTLMRNGTFTGRMRYSFLAFLAAKFFITGLLFRAYFRLAG